MENFIFYAVVIIIVQVSQNLAKRLRMYPEVRSEHENFDVSYINKINIRIKKMNKSIGKINELIKSCNLTC